MASEIPTFSVVLPVLAETTPGALYSLHDLFCAVGVGWSQATGEPVEVRARMRPVIASADGAAVASASGVSIVPEAAFGDIVHPDIIIVTDLLFDLMQDTRGCWPAEAAWLRRCHAQGSLVASVCTGSVFLAEAGLLDGLEATSHWAAVPAFRDHYPRVKLRPERILCPAGPGHAIVTAGGLSSWSELALYLVARFCGEAEARRIARLFLLGDHGEGQLPFAAMARPRQHDDAVIAGVQAWIAEHYTVANPVARMAALAGLSERTFARRFRRATGYGPVEYVQALRIEEAKQMLETTPEPTEAVALAVGYADPVSFRRLFRRLVGLTPARYRQRFARLPMPRRGSAA